MRMMRSSLETVIFLVAITPDAIAQGANTVVREWLLNACGVGETTSRSDLRSAGQAAVPELVRAFEHGPATADRDAARAAATRRFQLITFILDRGSTAGLSPAHLEAARRLTIHQFTERSVTDFAFLYRSEALRALGVLGGANAVTTLQRVASNPNSPFARTAQLAIEDLGRP